VSDRPPPNRRLSSKSSDSKGLERPAVDKKRAAKARSKVIEAPSDPIYGDDDSPLPGPADHHGAPPRRARGAPSPRR
jgi:hypothetical protein